MIDIKCYSDGVANATTFLFYYVMSDYLQSLFFSDCYLFGQINRTICHQTVTDQILPWQVPS